MKTINLPPLPSNWDTLTPEQMVQLNRIRIKEGTSKESFLFHAFCYLTGLKVYDSQKDEHGETYYLFHLKDSKETIPLAAWEIQFFISEKLKWLTEDCTRLIDVFPTLILRGRTFGSPGHAMAGMTYQQYKKTQEYVGYYYRLTNQIVSLLQSAKNGKVDSVKIFDLVEERKQIKGRFLAAVYTPESQVRSRIVDGQTVVCNPPEKAFVFSTGQIEAYGEWFEEVPEEKGDAVLQLFSGTMLNYRKMFPLLFPEKSEGKEQNMNFIQIESSTMNALQSKLGFNNYQTIYDSNAPFILEKLHAILKEGKALDEQSRKLKSKHR